MTAPYRSPAEIDALIPQRETMPVEPDWMNGESKSATVADWPRRRGNHPLSVAPAGLPALSWADLTAEPEAPPPVLAPGIPEVGLTVLAGPPKVGKTLYASQQALLVGRSTIVVEEGSLAGVSYRLRRQATALELVAPDLAVIHRQRIRLDNRASVARLREHVEQRRPKLLILDPLNRLHGADENRPSQMTPVMDALAGIAYDFGIAVVCVHHLAKPSAERRGDIWDRFRGATSIRSGTDSNLILDGNGATVHLVGEFRDAEPLSEWLSLDRDTLLFEPVEGPKVAGKVEPDALVAFLGEAERVTVAEVAARFGVTKPTARAALESLGGIDSFDGPRGTRYYMLGTGK